MPRLSLLGFFLLFAACSCEDTETLVAVRDCEKPCYGGEDGQAGVGACHLGRYVCAGDGQITCENYGLPSVEICNDFDDDCDGQLSPQEQDSDGDGITACEGDCAPDDPFVYPGADEACNGKDDDCDGIVDNPEQMEVQYCYEGPPGTLRPGAGCQPGYRTCWNGALTECIGQQLPSVEVCDDVDNDCDGLINEGLVQEGNYDFVVVMDISGSMDTILEQVKREIGAFARSHSDARYRYALLTIPGRTLEGTVEVITPYVDATSFVTELTALEVSRGGIEPSYDALVAVCSLADPLQTGRRPDATYTVLLFTDERGQSMAEPPNDELMAAQLCAASATTVFIWGAPGVQSSLDAPPQYTGGAWYDIYGELSESLRNAVALQCL